MHEITERLVRVSKGETGALDDLIPQVYDELRVIARAQLRDEDEGHTLTPTALVHEAYMRLARQHHLICKDRREFYALAATFMRRILVSHARKRLTQRRGAGQPTVRLGSDPDLPVTFQELVTLDDALEKLGARNPRLPVVVDLMFFGGFTYGEIAQVLRVSVSTVRRDWRLSRAWLSRELHRAL